MDTVLYIVWSACPVRASCMPLNLCSFFLRPSGGEEKGKKSDDIQGRYREHRVFAVWSTFILIVAESSFSTGLLLYWISFFLNLCRNQEKKLKTASMYLQ